MRQLLWRLDYLCTEIISINIGRYSKTSKDDWSLRYCNDLGDKLLLACLTNSKKQGLDENEFQFILDNFSIRQFVIFPKIYKTVKHFNFFNEKFIEKLKINTFGEIKLQKKNKKFSINIKYIRNNCR